MKLIDRFIYGDYTADATVKHGPRTAPQQPGRPAPVFDPERRRLWLIDAARDRREVLAAPRDMIRCRELPGREWKTCAQVIRELKLDCSPSLIAASFRGGIAARGHHFYRDDIKIEQVRTKNRPVRNLATGEEYPSINEALATLGLTKGSRQFHTAHMRVRRSALAPAGSRLAFGVPWQYITLAPAARAEAEQAA